VTVTPLDGAALAFVEGTDAAKKAAIRNAVPARNVNKEPPRYGKK
jgi:hypothetical protein